MVTTFSIVKYVSGPMSSNLTFKSRLRMFKSKSATKGGKDLRGLRGPGPLKVTMFPHPYIIIEFNYINIE